MQRSRLKNIINISKGISNKAVGDPFDRFLETLPKELVVGENYRMKAAWKAYGSPKDYKTALWEGMIQPIDENTYKLPSIGYNEETDEYEYLNKGKENETVDKDIRVWDNDVIPLVKELKLGGYVRTFNKEKDCWTYTKNSQKEDTLDQKGNSVGQKPNQQDVEFLKSENSIKKPYSEWKKTIDFDINDDYDLESAYNELPLEQLENWRVSKGKTHLDGRFKRENHITYSDPGYGWIGSDQVGWTFYPSPRQMQNRSFEDYVEYWKQNEPTSQLNYGGRTYVNTPIGYHKQGGQMSVIPEGALHARKNNMEGAGEDFTAKGIPVIDNQGEQQAEIERDEIIFRKQVTDKMEELYKKYNSEESSTKKDEIAIEMGKIITCEITKHTQDNTGLIDKIQNQ